MSYSDEWTEWHLTPRGWESGTQKTDFAGIVQKAAPADRVLTYKVQSSPWSHAHRGGTVLWRSPDKEAAKALLAKFGEPPGRV